MSGVDTEQPCEVVTSWPAPGFLLVEVAGEVDMFCTADIDAVEQEVRRSPSRVRIDLCGATMVDLNGAMHLEALATVVDESGATLELAGASERVLRILAKASSPLATAAWQDA